jgi:hypothetical protein
LVADRIIRPLLALKSVGRTYLLLTAEAQEQRQKKRCLDSLQVARKGHPFAEIQEEAELLRTDSVLQVVRKDYWFVVAVDFAHRMRT